MGRHCATCKCPPARYALQIRVHADGLLDVAPFGGFSPSSLRPGAELWTMKLQGDLSADGAWQKTAGGYEYRDAEGRTEATAEVNRAVDQER